MKQLAKKHNIPLYLFDTTTKNQREISMEVADTILDDVRKVYVKKIQDQYR